MSRLRQMARSFGSFWWDFLVGDTPELFLSVVVIIGVALVLRHHSAVAIIVLPVMAIAGLGASLWHGRRSP